ncbi:MAG: DUF3127 domain-containing protein [Bacteroidetes bacterium]|nr:DUF3127 domain-containing protein [Bacteroidota bacterium]MBX7046193.1 DUF3127 domain-containing protein [Ignavibacteria bacterium]
MNLSGKLLEIFQTKNISDKFKKREFVVEYAENANYPQTIAMEVQQDNCSILDKFSVGDTVDVTFDLRGRKWVSPQGETKYFNTLVAWKLAKAEGNNSGAEETSFMADDPDDLPF